jgi:hypothetical protein
MHESNAGKCHLLPPERVGCVCECDGDVLAHILLLPPLLLLLLWQVLLVAPSVALALLQLQLCLTLKSVPRWQQQWGPLSRQLGWA